MKAQRCLVLVQPIRSRVLLLIMVVLSAGLLMGCSRGAYPLDFFNEMHYNQSYKIQEPPSLSAPSDSVPMTGRGLDYTMEQARQLENPVHMTSAILEEGAQLFQVNCAVCHGFTGLGNGPMLERLQAAEYSGTPANLTAKGPTVGKPDGEVFLIITKGFGGVYPMLAEIFSVMPPFSKLLTEEERWTLVHYIRSLQ